MSRRSKNKVMVILTMIFILVANITSFAYTEYYERLDKINEALPKRAFATSYEQSHVRVCGDMQYAGSTTMTKNSDGTFTIRSNANVWNDEIQKQLVYKTYTSNSSYTEHTPGWDKSGNPQYVAQWNYSGNGWEKKRISGRILIFTFDDNELASWGDGTTIAPSVGASNAANRSSMQFAFKNDHYIIIEDYQTYHSFGDTSDAGSGTDSRREYETDEIVKWTYTYTYSNGTTRSWDRENNRRVYANYFVDRPYSESSLPYTTNFAVEQNYSARPVSEWTIKDLPSNCNGIYVMPFTWISYHHSGSEDDDYSYTTYMPSLANFLASGQGVFMKGYTVKYNANGGSTTPKTVENTEEVTLPSISRVGYTFAGWYKGNAKVGMNGAKYKPDADVTLTAHWTPRTDTKYVVKHHQMNLDGKNYTLKDTDTLKGTTDTNVTPATKSYTGFTAPAKQTVNINADGSRVVNYYYSRNKYTFTMGSNTSKYSHGINTSGSSANGSYYYGATITLKATPKAGYKWEGWSDGNKNQSRTVTMPANALTITPYGSLITYTIRYNTYEGNLQKEKVITYNVESPDIVLENPTLDGKEFLGWSDWNDPAPKKPYTIPKGTTGDLIISANWNTETTNPKYTGESRIKANRFKIKI